MQILLHIGMNKCASTFIQASLAGSQATLARAGTSYPVFGRSHATYGISKHYGFGPDSADVHSVGLAELVESARKRNLRRLIVSSEYLSIYRPDGVGQIVTEAEHLGANLRVVAFGREPMEWIRSLFNQYMKTVSGPGWLPDLNAFVAQVLRNRAIDIARRIRQWDEHLDAHRFSLFHISQEDAPNSVLLPIQNFAGTALQPPKAQDHNRSLSPDQLHHVGRLRKSSSTPSVERQIAKVLAGKIRSPAAPKDFLSIDPKLLDRLKQDIIGPAEALSWQPLLRSKVA